MSEKIDQFYVDKALIAIDPLGLYQISHLLLLITVCLPAASQLLSNVFTCRMLPYQCAHPENETFFLSQYSAHSNLTVTYGSCDVTVVGNGSVLFDEECPFGVIYQPSKDASAMSQFDLTCEKESLAKLSQTLVIAGQGIGAVISTGVSDKIGRKPVLVGSNLGLLACGLIIAYAPNYIVFAVFKFFVGCFQQGVVTTYTTYTLEQFPRQHRRLCASVTGMAWAISTMCMPPVAYLLKDHDWRTLQVAYSLVSLFAFIHWWYIDESIRWLFANGKTNQAIKCLKRAARMNKKDFNDVLNVFHKGDIDPDTLELLKNKETTEPVKSKTSTEKEEIVLDTATKKMSLLDLLRVRRLLVNALAIWFAWFTTALGFFTLYLTSTTLSGNRFLNFFFISCMEVPSNIYFYFFLNRFGRKVTTAGSFATLTAGLVLSGIALSFESTPTLDVLQLIGTLIGMAGASGSFGSVFSYTPEMFPTNLRNQALGISSFMGRIGGMLAPFTGILAKQAKWGPAALIAGCAIIVCLLLTILPETKHRELPQTLEDLQAWYPKKPSKKTANNNSEVKEKTAEANTEKNGTKKDKGSNVPI